MTNDNVQILGVSPFSKQNSWTVKQILNEMLDTAGTYE